MYKIIFIFFLFVLTFGVSTQAEEIKSDTTSIVAQLDYLKVKAVTFWGGRLCIVRFLDDAYELEIYRKNNAKEFVKIFTAKFDGVYHLDGSTSDDFLIIYGSSAVATQISLLHWDNLQQKVSIFDDKRFDSDSRLRPEIFMRPKGFSLLTYGNKHDLGYETDLSKWYANIYIFERGVLVSAKKVPYLKRLEGVSKRIF